MFESTSSPRHWSVPASCAWWKGQRVAVDVADGQKGPEAVGLRLI
jgi:hypothetical protein